MAKVMVVEPYYTGSHRSWADGVATHSTHDLRLVTHDGGFWKWRMHGAAVTLARCIKDTVAEWGRPDVVLVSDMVNVAALAGLSRHVLGRSSIVLYMHENQLTYPLPQGAVSDEGYAMANWVSMCAADVVAFNSEHHRGELLAALPRFLRKFPDHRHTSLMTEIEAKTVVVPLGIDRSVFELDRPAPDGPSPCSPSSPTTASSSAWPSPARVSKRSPISSQPRTSDLPTGSSISARPPPRSTASCSVGPMLW